MCFFLLAKQRNRLILMLISHYFDREKTDDPRVFPLISYHDMQLSWGNFVLC